MLATFGEAGSRKSEEKEDNERKNEEMQVDREEISKYNTSLGSFSLEFL